MKKRMVELVAKLGKETAIYGAGNPTLWGFGELDIPSELQQECLKRSKCVKNDRKSGKKRKQ